MADDWTNGDLAGLRVAVLVTDGYEQVEMIEPRRALDAAGAETVLVSPKDGAVQGFNHDKPADKAKVDLPLARADVDSFDALLLPGGVMNPDQLRMDAQAVDFVRAFFLADKPVAAICHGPWTIIEADQARGRRMTSWPSLRTDLKNAGAEAVDEAVVVDGKLVTSRKPDDIPDFNREMIRVFGQAKGGARL